MMKPEEHVHTIRYCDFQNIITGVQYEITLAEQKHPNWPDDPLYGAAIMQEEAGEAVQACIEAVYGRKPFDDYYKELVQTAAMCFRALADLRVRGFRDRPMNG